MRGAGYAEMEAAFARGIGDGAARGGHFSEGPAAIIIDVGFHAALPKALIRVVDAEFNECYPQVESGADRHCPALLLDSRGRFRLRSPRTAGRQRLAFFNGIQGGSR